MTNHYAAITFTFTIASLLELGLKFLVFSSLENSDNRGGLASVGLVVEVGLGELDSRAAFLWRGSSSDPNEDGVDGVNNEDVAWVEAGAGPFDFLDLEGSRGVGDLHDALLVLEVGIATSFSGGLDGLLSSEVFPEEVGVVVSVLLVEGVDLDLASTLIVNSTNQLSGGGLLSGSSASRLEGVELESNVEDEHVTEIEGVGGRWDLADDGVVELSFDVEETRNVLLRFNVLESSFNATSEDFEFLEELEEIVAFAALNLTVLDRQAVQVIVEFYGLVCSGTSLVESGVLTEPKVNIVQKLVLFLVRVEHDVAVAGIELTVSVIGPCDYLEFFYTPYFGTDFFASFLPGRFALSSVLLNLLLERRTEEGHVGIGNIDLGFFEHCGLCREVR